MDDGAGEGEGMEGWMKPPPPVSPSVVIAIFTVVVDDMLDKIEVGEVGIKAGFEYVLRSTSVPAN